MEATTVDLEQEAFSLAETGFLTLGFKSGQSDYISVQHQALKTWVEARLLKRHPQVSLAHLRDIAEYGVDKTFATQGQQSYDVPMSQAAAVGGVVYNDYQSVKHTGESLTSFLGALTDPTTWLRGVYVVGGGLLILSGVFMVAKELGAPTPTPPIFHAKKLIGK